MSARKRGRVHVCIEIRMYTCTGWSVGTRMVRVKHENKIGFLPETALSSHVHVHRYFRNKYTVYQSVFQPCELGDTSKIFFPPIG